MTAPFDVAPLLAPGTPAARRQVERLSQVQFRRRPQRRQERAGTGADRRGHGRAEARGCHARDLRAEQRPARLPAAARVPVGQAQEPCRNRLHGRRNPDHLGLAAGPRPGQYPAARQRRHDPDREGDLRRRAQPPRQVRRQHRRHPARQRRHAHGCAQGQARGAQGQGHHAEIHLHHPDGAEPDRLDHARGTAAGDDRARPRVRHDDLRGRVLFRPGLVGQAAGLDLFAWPAAMA